eukprot:964738-Pyramimonas_sp.AAC.1
MRAFFLPVEAAAAGAPAVGPMPLLRSLSSSSPGHARQRRPGREFHRHLLAAAGARRRRDLHGDLARARAQRGRR